jgi:hypothetical protein
MDPAPVQTEVYYGRGTNKNVTQHFSLWFFLPGGAGPGADCRP